MSSKQFFGGVVALVSCTVASCGSCPIDEVIARQTTTSIEQAVSTTTQHDPIETTDPGSPPAPEQTISASQAMAEERAEDFSDEVPTEILELVGMDFETFTGEIQALGYIVRVVEQDGEGVMVDAAYRSNRMNVGVEGCTVTEVRSAG